MSIGFAEKQINADALQREVEERERKRKRETLQSEIGSLDTRSKYLKERIVSLGWHRSQLDSYIEDWENERNSFSKNDISQVVITNVFEGVCADKIKSDLETCIAQMDQTCDKVRGLRNNIEKQITKLGEYQSNIDETLLIKRDELRSI